MSHLTILHISFAKNFCQKKVKKNCKSVARVFFKKADMTHSETPGKHTPFLW